MILGFGFPTLISSGKPCIIVKDVKDVIIASVILDTGPNYTPTLLQWGTTNDCNPGVGFDIYTRVGGESPYKTKCDSMVTINSSGVLGDNFWLWRADHDIKGLTYFEENYVENGLRVFGTNVTTYGVAAEHSFGDQVQWTGEFGEAWFFQSELPYSVT